jgi:hypothetical protein
MVYSNWDYWVFGLSPPPTVLKNTKEYSILETGSLMQATE